MAVTTGILIVSHSPRLAEGVVELAAQMAPDIPLRATGGLEDGSLGSSYELIEHTAAQLLGTDGAEALVVLTDLGSATMTAEAVIEVLTADGKQAVLANAPLVEGAVAAAVAAQGGGGRDVVQQAAEEAAGEIGTQQPATPTASEPVAEAPQQRDLVLHNKLGLHARAAAMVSRLVAGFDARVEINGVDAASVLALMGLGLERGATMDVRASGSQAEHALDAVGDLVADRFDEE